MKIKIFQINDSCRCSTYYDDDIPIYTLYIWTGQDNSIAIKMKTKFDNLNVPIYVADMLLAAT